MSSQERSYELERLRSDAEYMRFLVAAGELLASSLDYRSTLQNICRAAVASIADICILDIGSLSDIETVGACHKDPALTPELVHAETQLHHETGRPAHPVCKVLDSGQTFFAPHVDEAWIEKHACNVAHAAFMRRMQYRSMIVVPVRSQVWGLTGTLTLVRTALSSAPYETSGVSFAEDLGRRCGAAIGKARLHSQTLDIARRFQKAALPHCLPQIPGFEFDAFYEPADAALLVGGDWYDAFLLEDGKIGVSIGDVSGHGLDSAALMSSIRNALRMALVMEDDLAVVLRRADFLFRSEAPGIFCTALVAVIDPATGRGRCASAGHPGPAIWSRGRVISPVRNPGVPLGCGDIARIPAESREMQLERGAIAVFYTDGLVEWRGDHVAGEKALYAALQQPEVRHAQSPARAIRDTVITGAHADDIAILTVRYAGRE